MFCDLLLVQRPICGVLALAILWCIYLWSSKETKENIFELISGMGIVISAHICILFIFVLIAVAIWGLAGERV